MLDSKGAIYEGREDLDGMKVEIARLTNKEKKAGGLKEMMQGSDIFIGVSKAGLVDQQMVRSMNKDPIIFTLANPEPEISVTLAKEAGALVVATGRSDFPNQVNNSLAFPGLFRGALDNKIKQFEPYMFVKAAEELASFVINPTPEKIIPGPFEEGIAERVARVVR